MEKYQFELMDYASKLDAISSGAGEIVEYTKKIVNECDDSAIKWLLAKIDAVSRNSDKRLKFIGKQLYDSLLLFLGNLRLSEIVEDTSQCDNGKTLEELRNELDSYIGLDSVKQKVYSLISFHKIQQLREKSNLKNTKCTLHMAFLGNPGTGKTSVARIVGQMYKKIGLLSKGHFIEASRTDLIAGYQGQTALKVKKIIDKAKGGVLFIDEAYSITENANSDSYGRECLTELTKALEDYREDLVVIVAGYEAPMKQFFESNPGLKSRFNTYIYFDDYNADQLMSILEKMCNDNDYILSDALKNKMHDYFMQKINEKKDHFSNGRLVRNLYDDLIMNHAKRLVETEEFSAAALALLEEKDFDELQFISER